MRERSIKKNFYLNDREEKLLKRNSKKAGLTESSYLRMLIEGYKPMEQPTQELFETIELLRRISNSLNQIARKANTLNIIDAYYYKEVAERLKVFMEEFQYQFFDLKR